MLCQQENYLLTAMLSGGRTTVGAVLYGIWMSKANGKGKSFSGTTKAEVNKKMTEYIAAFNESIIESQETKKRLSDSMQNWLDVFKFPSVERTTYDRYECTAKNQIYPYIGDKVVGDVKSADIKKIAQ